MKTESTNACPKCGAPVPPEAPQGLCPQCVLSAAAAPEPSPTATSEIPSFERLAAAFPQLQVVELIGRGAMGFVFKARQPHLDRFVALKLLPDSLAQDPHFAERFNREGRTLARLNHPNIVSIFDFGQAGGFYYLLMEYVDGVNLRQAMQAGRFSPSEALAIVPKICEALQYAHEEGVLHRDIKPENILLDAKGRVKIADFGIAKIIGEEKAELALTGTGAALGTPHYMAPEQLEKPGTVDHRADIYSLGVVFYEMLTGELPLGRFAPPSQRTPVDPRVDDVVMRTLEKEREKRFQSAGEMKTNVEHLTEAGAGSFKTSPAKISHAERGPGGTTVLPPLPDAPKWSIKAICAAVLVAISLPVPVFLSALAAYASTRGGGISGWEMLIALALMSVTSLPGTILGWMALSDIRVHEGKLRGLPLAVFGALALPILLLLGVTLIIPALSLYHAAGRGSGPGLLTQLLLASVPAGAITFAIWASYTAARWGANKPKTQRRGVLKWVFLALLLSGMGFFVIAKNLRVRQVHYVNTPPTTAPPLASVPETNSAMERRIELAREQLEAVQQRINAGAATQRELAAVQRDLEIAEARGDVVKVAEAKLKFAQYDAKLTRQRVETGTVSVGEMREAELRQAIAEIDLQQALRNQSVKPVGPAPQKPRASALQFRLVADSTDNDSSVEIMVQQPERGPAEQLRVLRTVLLDGSSVARAGDDSDALSRIIAVELTPEGARQFAAITATNIKRQLAIVAGGKVLSAPIIKQAITGGELRISGGMPSNEMYGLVGALNGNPIGLQFSPPIERSLPRANQNIAVGLDLETGTHMTNHSFAAARRTAMFSFETNGVDLIAFGTNEQSLVALGSVLIEAPPGAWDSMSAQEVGWNWKLMRSAAKEYTMFGVASGGVDTFMFRTHENGFGLVQFLPVTNAATEVRIRYKLVQTTNTNSDPSASTKSLTNSNIGWLRGTWFYDKEYSTKKTEEMRAAFTGPQKSLQDVVTGIQKSGSTNQGMPDLSRVTADMTALTAGMMFSLKDTMEQQLILDLLTGTQLTFDETEMRSISRLAPPAVTRYDEIKNIDPTTIQLRWGGTNSVIYQLEGDRFRVTDMPISSVVFYFKRLPLTNSTTAKP